MTSHHEPFAPVLRCRECSREAPAEGPQYCGWCFAAVEVVLGPLEPAEAPAVRGSIEAGPRSLARYETLLPTGLSMRDIEAGWTPLHRADALGRAIGLEALWLKDETANPTGSFKDRVVEVAVARGVARGARVVACSSTGNLARAVAAAAARRGLAAVVLVPEELDSVQVAELVRLGATVVAVRGGYDAASRLATEAASDLEQWAWVNVTLRPWYELGARTVGWEIAEQLGWRLPDRVAAPVASGALVRAIHDAMEHLIAGGMVDGPLARVTALQPAGCDPVAAAFATGSDSINPLRSPHTVAASLAMGDPPDGPAVIAAARATGGIVHAVAESAILDAAALVERCEGIAVEPAGGVVVAGLRDLVESGAIAPNETVVAVLTGAPPRASAGRVAPGDGLAGTISASLGALIELLPDDFLR